MDSIAFIRELREYLGEEGISIGNLQAIEARIATIETLLIEKKILLSEEIEKELSRRLETTLEAIKNPPANT